MRLKDENKRIAIIDTTLDIVLEKGFAGVKMSTVAKKVGISVSTLYVYYANKEDLISSIATELIERVIIQSNQSFTHNLPFKLRLKSVWSYWVDFSINNRKEMNFITRVKQSPYYDKVPMAIKDIKSKLSIELFELGKQEGLIRNVDNEVLEAITRAILYETVELILTKKMTQNDEDMDLMFSFVWNAIKS